MAEGTIQMQTLHCTAELYYDGLHTLLPPRNTHRVSHLTVVCGGLNITATHPLPAPDELFTK